MKEVRQVISRHYAKFRDTCAAVISEGVETGAFKSVNPHVYASFVVSVIDGISLQWLFDENVFNYDEMIKTAKGLILEGLVK